MEDAAQLTFEATDKLGLKPFSEKLERFLSVEHDFVDGSLVVSLNAPFGAGKTTFLSMWKSDLDKRYTENPNLPKAIMLNAWESDYCGDALLSIVNGLIKAAKTDNASEDAVGRLRDAAKDVGWFVLGLANNLASHWSGIDPHAAGELAEEKRKDRRPEVPDFVSLYDKRTEALDKLKSSLREVFGGDTPRAFVFIDELDRCRPDYAISYLETIKHVFDIHGLVFVLAIDYSQLESAAKALFGSGLKFPDYFRKFSHRNVSLPEPEDQHLQQLAYYYVTRYLHLEGKRASRMGDHDFRVKNIVELIRALRMPPRQIQETFRIIGHTVAASDAQRQGKLYWCLSVGVILMAALKVANPEMYTRIGRSELSHKDAGNYLISLLGQKEADWWFRVYVTGSGRKECEDEASVEALFRDLKFTTEDVLPNGRRDLGQFASGWGHHWSDRWKQIYQFIETATTF